MNRLSISTRSICSWRERLANPDRQWKPKYSAFETAVSWEYASRSTSGIPGPILDLFQTREFGEPCLLLAVAEHKVDLPGGNAASQSDVWALIKTSAGTVSLTVEAKAREAFGDETLDKWLTVGAIPPAKTNPNRQKRWNYIAAHLPVLNSYSNIRYQMLHRCAASVIEAKRFGLQHAAFVVQAFDTPHTSFRDYELFCQALNLPAKRGGMATTSVDGVSLSVGWADCPLATADQIAAVV